jgi:hypothetical protein
VECQEGSYDAFTLELRVLVSENDQVVFPCTEKVLKNDVNEYEKTKAKWKVVPFTIVGSSGKEEGVECVTTTVATLRDFAIAGIKEHGKYSVINSSQDFIKCVLDKVAKEVGPRYRHATTTDADLMVFSVSGAAGLVTKAFVAKSAAAMLVPWGVGFFPAASVALVPLAAYAYIKHQNRSQKLETAQENDEQSGDD